MMMKILDTRTLFLAAGMMLAILVDPVTVHAADDEAMKAGEQKTTDKMAKPVVRKTRVREIKTKGDPVKELENSASNSFCEGIRDSARERRYALKTKELNKLKAAVEERIKLLEVKRAEFEEWNEKRDKFLKLAEGNLIEIYSKMRPDAAAGRLEILSKPLAAAILMKLSPRKAGVILNEMKAETAAEITQVIASSADVGKKT